MRALWAAALLLAGGPKTAAAAETLSLAEALEVARANQPAVLQARANAAAARAQALSARAALMPGLVGTAGYQRSSANFVARPGSVPQQFSSSVRRSTWKSYGYYSLGLTLTQTVYDFGQTPAKSQAAAAAAEALEATAHSALVNALYGVRAAYFAARAARDLSQVAAAALANQERHLQQIAGFVAVGTRPEIDLLQGRTDRANALVAQLTAANAYATSRATLNQAMGRDTEVAFEVGDDGLLPLAEEDKPLADLVAAALAARPDYAAVGRSLAAQELTLRSARGAWGPSLGLTTGLTDAGLEGQRLTWNWNAGLTLTWNLFAGGATAAAVAQAEAQAASLRAQRRALAQQAQLQVTQAQLAVGAGRAALAASDEAEANAQALLRQAEGRYAAQVGGVIELADAQLAHSQAAAQRVQATYTLAAARAQLLQALGRE